MHSPWSLQDIKFRDQCFFKASNTRKSYCLFWCDDVKVGRKFQWQNPDHISFCRWIEAITESPSTCLGHEHAIKGTGFSPRVFDGCKLSNSEWQNGLINWVKCNFVWNHTLAVLRSNEHLARDRFEILGILVWFQTKLPDKKFNHHFITVILKSQNPVSSNTVKTVLEAALSKSGNKKGFTSHLHFLFETEKTKNGAIQNKIGAI